MVADPKFTPVICGVEEGVVAPAEMKMLAGEMVSFEVSLLPRLMKAPPGPAAEERVTGKGTCWPGDTVTLDGSVIGDVTVLTVMFAVPLVIFVALAVIVDVAFPVALAGTVTGTVMLVAPPMKLSVAGTVAAAVFDELRFTVRPA